MFYIGVHKTTDPNDDYLGSGKRLKYAIKKYGVENFVKEVLYSFETKEEAFSKEKELVTEEVLDSGKCYNLKIGGEGGWDFANQSYDSHKRKNLSLIGNEKISKNDEIDPIRRSLRAANTAKTRFKIYGKYFLGDERFDWNGKTHSDETKRKISQTLKGAREGSKNSQFGTKWITDGILNKKIKKDQEIPEGWRSGRK
jgi:hypothetical protein